MKEDSKPADLSEPPPFLMKTVRIGSGGHAHANVGASKGGEKSFFRTNQGFACLCRMDVNEYGVDVESVTIATASVNSTDMEAHL